LKCNLPKASAVSMVVTNLRIQLVRMKVNAFINASSYDIHHVERFYTLTPNFWIDKEFNLIASISDLAEIEVDQ
jgi:hypothetical protein